MTDNMPDKLWADDCSTFTTKPDDMDGVIEYTRSDNHVVIPRDVLEGMMPTAQELESEIEYISAFYRLCGQRDLIDKLLKEY